MPCKGCLLNIQSYAKVSQHQLSCKAVLCIGNLLSHCRDCSRRNCLCCPTYLKMHYFIQLFNASMALKSRRTFALEEAYNNFPSSSPISGFRHDSISSYPFFWFSLLLAAIWFHFCSQKLSLVKELFVYKDIQFEFPMFSKTFSQGLSSSQLTCTSKELGSTFLKWFTERCKPVSAGIGTPLLLWMVWF